MAPDHPGPPDASAPAVSRLHTASPGPATPAPDAVRPSPSRPRGTGRGRSAPPGRRSVRRLAMLAVAAIGLTATACADDGRDLAEPGPDQTTTTPTVAADSTTTVVAMRVTSGSFSDGGEIPPSNTCAAEDVPPMLTWTGVPMGTAELAIVMRDLDAEGFIHWVVAGIPAGAAGISGGAMPEGAVEALNDFGRPGWAGPCPEAGTHHYEFRVHALAQPSGLQAGAPARQSAEQIEVLPMTATAVISGTATAPTA